MNNLIFFILIFGFLFGAIMQYASLNKYNVISGLAMRENFAVPKTIFLAIGIGIMVLSVEVGLGFASFHIKPFILGGVVLGGLIFGSGMAILGYCPGTLPISAGEGSLDAVIGIIGGLLGGLVYTLLLPSMHIILGPDFGSVSLNSLTGTNFIFYLLSFIIGVIFIGISFWLNKFGKPEFINNKWIVSGIAFAILNPIVFLTVLSNRPIGASTAFPYAADLLAGITNNDYFSKIQVPGNWELIFGAGALLAGLIISLIKKDFKITLIHDNWKRFKGPSEIKRIVWAFVAGFILIFGARMAGGCTSGHILSGGMQLAVSSLTFAVFVFVGLLITGKLFYKKN